MPPPWHHLREITNIQYTMTTHDHAKWATNLTQKLPFLKFALTTRTQNVDDVAHQSLILKNKLT